MWNRRPRLSACLVACSVAPIAASAAQLQVGPIDDKTTCVGSEGSGASPSCSRLIEGEATDETTYTWVIRAQASADSGGVGDDEEVEQRVRVEVPFVVTRDITLIPDPDGPGPGLARLETPSLYITVALLDSRLRAQAGAAPVGGGLQIATVRGGGEWGTDLAGFKPLTEADDVSVADGDGTYVAISYSEVGYSRGVSAGGPPVEIDIAAQIPEDFRLWTDFEAPQALDYSQPAQFEQSLADVLRVSFRLRAQSRPSGSISTNGGEAIACTGLGSARAAFSLNSQIGECGNGVRVALTLETGLPVAVDVANAPEPMALLAGVAALFGLALMARRGLRDVSRTS